MQAMQSQGISHAVQLEQWLMEGAYNKVLEARPQLPDPAYSYFMEKLLSTVRYSTFLLQAFEDSHSPWQHSVAPIGPMCRSHMPCLCSHTPLWLLHHAPGANAAHAKLPVPKPAVLNLEHAGGAGRK